MFKREKFVYLTLCWSVFHAPTGFQWNHSLSEMCWTNHTASSVEVGVQLSIEKAKSSSVFHSKHHHFSYLSSKLLISDKSISHTPLYCILCKKARCWIRTHPVWRGLTTTSADTPRDSLLTAYLTKGSKQSVQHRLENTLGFLPKRTQLGSIYCIETSGDLETSSSVVLLTNNYNPLRPSGQHFSHHLNHLL